MCNGNLRFLMGGLSWIWAPTIASVPNIPAEQGKNLDWISAYACTSIAVRLLNLSSLRL